MRAVVSVIGRDQVGIIARVSRVLAEHNVNILDISQTILENMFTMIMRVELLDENAQVAALNQTLAEAGKDIGLDIRLQRQDIFDAMHRV